jgi:hypothetical protein
MSIADLIRTAGITYEDRRIIERGARLANAKKATPAPADLRDGELELFFRAVEAAGGTRPSKSRRDSDANVKAIRAMTQHGEYEVRRRNGKPSPAELLREALCSSDGTRAIAAVKAAIDDRLEDYPDERVGVQMAFEYVRWNGVGGMAGAYKIDNDAASAVARWLLACWPDQYRGLIELRGSSDDAASWPWLDVNRPYQPLYRTPAGTPVPYAFLPTPEPY